MRLPLVRHVDAPCEAVSDISVDVTRTPDGGLTLRYVVLGSVGSILLANPTDPERSHHLWRHSCFEVFVKVPGDVGYQEYNFAPSSHWAAYGFASRRAGIHNLDVIAAPLIDSLRNENEFRLTASLAKIGLPDCKPWQLGLSVIIEENSGALSFWALAHPLGVADFHHDDCFAITLPAPEHLK